MCIVVCLTNIRCIWKFSSNLSSLRSSFVALYLASVPDLTTTIHSYFSKILNYSQQEHTILKQNVYHWVCLPSQHQNTQQLPLIFINKVFSWGILNISKNSSGSRDLDKDYKIDLLHSLQRQSQEVAP